MALADIYQKASLVQIPSGYKAADAELYSVVPNTTAGDFTVSVDADATRVNKDGLIETTVANQARLNYDPANPQDPHLLLEPSRTNYATNNSSMDTYGTVGGSSPSPTLTADYTTAPDGSNTATRFQATVTGSNYSLIQFPSTALGDGTYYISVYAKSNTGSNQTISFYGNSSPTNAHTVTPEWTRIIVEATRGSGITKYAYLGTWASQHGSDASIDISVWGAQIEVDSSYATSLIPTSTSAVTRTEDFCYIASGLGNVLNTSEGTLFVDVEVPRVSTSGSYERISLTDQTSATDRILIDNFGGNWRALTLSSAGTEAVTVRSTQANTRIKIAFAYSSSQIRVSYDGNDATTTSISYTPTTTLESFKFSNKDGGNKWQGKIHQAMYFDTALTNAELKTLTS